MGADCIDDGGDAIAAEPGRRSATEVDGGQWTAGRSAAADLLELDSERAKVFIHRSIGSHRDRKIAVRAAASAKRNVDVEMLRGHTRIYGDRRLGADGVLH